MIVTPYDDLYKLIEGERRYACAKLEGIKEIPAIIVNRMSGHDEVVAMFNLHMQRRGWRIGEELVAIERLMSENGHLSHDEMAKELGMSLRTFKDRLDLLKMEPLIRKAIIRGDLDPYVALRARQAARTLTRNRPEMAARLGGEAVLQDKMIKKGKKHGKGKTREFEQIKAEARDIEVTPDEVLEAYIDQEELSLAEARKQAATLQERRAVEELAKRVSGLEKELRHFRIDLDAAPNLRELRHALGSLAETAASLELRVSEAMRNAGIAS